jgi:uroporphyrinogen-III synthase
VVDWLKRFVAAPPDDLILFTGEGLQRLHRLAEREGIAVAFVGALTSVRKITRGPKPARRLRELGLKPDLAAEPPTTAGIIATLEAHDLAGRRIAVQLYPDMPQAELVAFLQSRGAAVDTVLPYAYASAAEEERVVAAIEDMAAGRADLIAFTSSPQLRRLRQVERARGLDAALAQGMARTQVAAVGPVVTAALDAAGFPASIAPESNFHMRPMVNAIVDALGRGATA